MAILYGILIAALMGASAFGGFLLCLKVKGKPEVRKMVYPIGDTSEEEEIKKAAFEGVFNLENPPTADEFARKFQPRSASQELTHATRPK